MRGSEVTRIEDRLVQHPQPGTFTAAELEGLPSAARQYFGTAIAPGAPLAMAARLRMRGRIKIGRWLPFRAREVLSPHDGLVWRARAAGVGMGSDSYLDGAGVMDWKLAGLSESCTLKARTCLAAVLVEQAPRRCGSRRRCSHASTWPGRRRASTT